MLKRRTSKILFLVMTLLGVVSDHTTVGQSFDRGKAKRKFNCVLVDKDRHELISATFDYKQKFTRQSGDTLIYDFRFQHFVDKEAEVLVVDDVIFITNQWDYDPRIQKLMDFHASKGEKWTVDGMFGCLSATIILEHKKFNTLLQDTVFQFIINGEGYGSHSAWVRRFYATRKLGVVKVDFFFEKLSDGFEHGMLVSDDYVRRKDLGAYCKDGRVKWGE